jgi:hypothetical protein
MNPDNTNHTETPALIECALRFQINDHGRVLFHGD